MIDLEVSDYCEKCPDFEADVEKRKIVSPRNREWIDTIVRCKHRKRCQNMINYLAEKREEFFK